MHVLNSSVSEAAHHSAKAGGQSSASKNLSHSIRVIHFPLISSVNKFGLLLIQYSYYRLKVNEFQRPLESCGVLAAVKEGNKEKETEIFLIFFVCLKQKHLFSTGGSAAAANGGLATPKRRRSSKTSSMNCYSSETSPTPSLTAFSVHP